MGSKLSVIEICAGAGGQALGLERAGFEHELAIELDGTAAATMRGNRPDWEVRVGDVADPAIWRPSDFAPEAPGPTIDLFAGGVPCPPFSIAGKQLGASDERDLFAWAVEQVGVMRPNAVMLENVKGLSQAKFAAYRQHVLDKLWGFGYEAEWKLVNAADFGVPQLRPRFVLVAMKPEYFRYLHWPEPSDERVSVGDALVDLMGAAGWEGATAWSAEANGIGPTLVGGSKKHGGADLGPTRAKAAWAKLGVDGRGVADAPPSAGDRFEVGPRLTLDMVKRIQGWDDAEYAWHFEGRKTSVYRQIGNAFPPPVAKAIGTQIAAALRQEGIPRAASTRRQDADVFVSVLKAQSRFISADRLRVLAGFEGDQSQFDARIASLAQSYELEQKVTNGEGYYKLGEFKAFMGQAGHERHQKFQESLRRIS